MNELRTNNKIKNKYKHNTQTITQIIMIKITRMIRYLLLKFVNVADGDLPTKLSGYL